ncbi:hypothetical protein F3Y22_tig00110044pilonHSYRG00057 [Hibiscus syriacus]|uniref:Berberine/berberine-like domain-containing protein n=1 Tax=Hibiscus syriacus TaxID=106335 RepID=A0A6A3BLH6_HIBSY|nr:hypothetical protein F3Y22_tig00110044pilonHSYRG00057 [Hibiscus syriacus]
MNSSHFNYHSTFPQLFAVLLAFSWLITAEAQTHEQFLHCLSLHSKDSSTISMLTYSPNNRSCSSILESSIQNLRFDTAATPKPLLIVTLVHASHIQATVHCSRTHGLQIRTRSGGHDFGGLWHVSEVPINEKSKTLAFPAGTCPTIDVGDHFSGGGILNRKFMGEDLFWAIRGGGRGSFRIVLDWKLRLVPTSDSTNRDRLPSHQNHGTKRSSTHPSVAVHTWIRRFYDEMTPYVSKSPREVNVNYRDSDIGANNRSGNTSYAEARIWGSKYFKNNFKRLAIVKTLVDPQNFKHEQSIPSLSSS